VLITLSIFSAIYFCVLFCWINHFFQFSSSFIAILSCILTHCICDRQFLRPNAADLSDYGCFVVLALGVASLQMIDISLIYHVIRGQGTIKLYVVYNVLEVSKAVCWKFICSIT
jgi:hypothetical protein